MTSVTETSAPAAPADEPLDEPDERSEAATEESDTAADRFVGRGRHRKAKRAPAKGAKGFLKELPILIILALGLALLIKTFLVQAFYIPSPSMEPTLIPGDRVLVNKVGLDFHEPNRGDIVVFENPNFEREPQGALGRLTSWLVEGLGFAQAPEEDFIKRVIGLPGETVEGKDGKVFVNGVALDEPYVNARTSDFDPVTIPEGKIWVMGDNRANSSDSRVFGAIELDSVVGRAFVKIWPPSRLGWL